MKKKILITLTTIACAVLLVVGSVAGTMAYLRATASVTNTFTYGKIAITMDETAINPADGMTPLAGAARVTGNTYKLMPGTLYTKDPQIHISADSEDLFLFVKIDNGVAGLAATDDGNYKTIHQQMLANGWNVLPYINVDAEGEASFDATKSYYNVIHTATNAGLTMEATSTVYFYGSFNGTIPMPTVVSNQIQVVNNDLQGTTNLPVGTVPTFTKFKLMSDAATEGSLTVYVNNDAKIVVQAYAVQASGFVTEANQEINTFVDAANLFASSWTSAAPSALDDENSTPGVEENT